MELKNLKKLTTLTHAAFTSKRVNNTFLHALGVVVNLNVTKHEFLLYKHVIFIKIVSKLDCTYVKQ